MDVIGRMKWFGQRPGALNALARDFDVLDDDTVASASVERGRLHTRAESYAVVVLPGCEVLEDATAARLVEFVDAGGMLVAVGSLPQAESGAAAALGERFAAGAAVHVDAPDDLATALADAPAAVEAPVPTLLRRDGDRAVLFVPAVHPRATEIDIDGEADDWHSWTRDLRYRFDADAPATAMDVVVRGVSGAPQLWEPFSGARRPVESEAVDGGVRVRVTFDDGPCALLVWGADGEPEARSESSAGDATTLDGPWEVELVRTLEDEWGDLAAPAADVETWELEHRTDDSAWAPVHATFGPRASVMRGTGVRPAEWSPSRGIYKDPVHIDYLGGSGRVPEEFLHFGPAAAGDVVRVRR